MTIRRRWGAFFLSSATVLALGWLPLLAQEPNTEKDKAADPPPAQPPAAKRVYDPARRVPSFFGQVGLTPEQRESIYKLRGKHLGRINELQKEIDRAQAEMMADCEAVLTDTQKQLLENLRRAAAEKRKARSSAAEAPAPPKPSSKSAG
jgi:hypothetical protein